MNSTELLTSTNQITSLSVTAARRQLTEYVPQLHSNAVAVGTNNHRHLEDSNSVTITFSIDVKIDDYGYSPSSEISADEYAETLVTAFTTTLSADLYADNGVFVTVFEKASGISVTISGDTLATMVETIRTEFTTANRNLFPTSQPTPVPTSVLNREFDGSKPGMAFGLIVGISVLGGAVFLLAANALKGYFLPRNLRRIFRIRTSKIAPETADFPEFLDVFPQYNSPRSKQITSKVSPVLSPRQRLEERRRQREDTRRARLEEEFGPIPEVGRTEGMVG